jgi:uncharacterized protein YndB with AHSA1/START domain
VKHAGGGGWPPRPTEAARDGEAQPTGAEVHDVGLGELAADAHVRGEEHIAARVSPRTGVAVRLAEQAPEGVEPSARVPRERPPADLVMEELSVFDHEAEDVSHRGHLVHRARQRQSSGTSTIAGPGPRESNDTRGRPGGDSPRSCRAGGRPRSRSIRATTAWVGPVADAEVQLVASPERVWRAFEPTGLRGWLCEEAEGALDPGTRLTLAWPSLGLATALSVGEVDPGRRLVLRGSDLDAGEEQVTVLTPTPGGTHVAVRHGGFGTGRRATDRAAGSAAGWHVALRLLDLYLGGREGRVLAARSAVGTAAVSPAELWPRLGGSSAGLAGWLGPIALEPSAEDAGWSELAEGRALVLGLGRRSLRAVVLARVPPYELALALPAIDAVFRVRLISLDGDREAGSTLACAQLVGWSGDELLAPLAAPLAAALDRLLAGRGAPAASA